MEDPFAVLGVRADASAPAVRAAYRRLAKRLHPDVPGTGDAAAYLRLRRAYDAARQPRVAPPSGGAADPGPKRAPDPGPQPGPEYDPEHVGVWAVRHAAREQPGWEAAVEPAPAPTSWPGLAALRPVAIALGVGVVFAGGLRLWDRPPPAPPAPAAAHAPSNAPSNALAYGSPNAASTARREPSGSRPEGAAAAPEMAGSYYVRPGSAPATLFRYDAASHRYAADGRLLAFALVRVRRIVPDSGMAEIAGPDPARPAYVLAEALDSGDAHAALTSRCVYEAGRPPVPGEILSRPSADPAAAATRPVSIENAGDLSAVFSLRDADDLPVVSVFLGPHDVVTLPLPPGRYRAAYASGDLWSRACGRFVAGGRAARMLRPEPLPLRYVLPISGAAELPDGTVADPIP